MNRILAFAAAGMLLCLSAAPAQSRRTPPRAITGAKVVTAAGEAPVTATILIRDGRIESVGPDVQVPPDAEILDAAGLTAYPALIDAATGLGLDPGLKQRRSTSGGGEDQDAGEHAFARSLEVWRKGVYPEFDAAEFTTLPDADADPWREAGFGAIHVVPSGEIIEGTSFLRTLAPGADRDAVVLPRAMMVTGWSTEGTSYPRSLMGVIAHLRQTLLDARHYAAAHAAWSARPDLNLRPPHDPAMEALAPVLDATMPLLVPASSLSEIHRAFAIADEFGLRLVILGGEEAWRVADELRERGIPVLLRIDIPAEPKQGAIHVERLEDAARRWGRDIHEDLRKKAESADKKNRVPEPDRAFEDRKREWGELVANARVLREKGVEIGISTLGAKDPEAFGKNLDRLIKDGLEADAALEALTAGTARALGLGDTLGGISPGRIANIMLLDGEFAAEESRVRVLIAEGDKFDFRLRTPKDDREDEAKEESGKDESDAESETTDAESENESESKEEAKEDADAAPVPQRAVETDADRRPSTRTGGDVFIRNATVLTMTGATHENTSILIRGGIIEALGAALTPPDGVTIIDGAGAWVMPGIVDCHSHMAIERGINEWTDSITAQCRIQDVLLGDDITLHRAAAGGVTSANVLHGSANAIGGQRAVIRMKYDTPVADLLFPGQIPGIKFALGENVIRNQARFPNSRLGVEAVIRRAFREARDYARETADWNALPDAERPLRTPPRRDLRLEALAEVLAGSRLVHCHSYNMDEMLMIMDLLREFGVERLTFEHGLEAFKIAPEIAEFGAFVSTFADYWGYKLEAFDAVPYNVALVEEAGGVGVLNSDSDERVRRMNTEAARMVRYGGLSYEAALRTITINPARALGIDSLVGTVEAGRRADLALWNGHPLNIFSRCFLTLIDGEVVFERGGERGGPYPLAPKTEAPPLPVADENPDGIYVITNARIHPVSAPVIESGSILIRAGKIESLGERISVPDSATVLDARGLNVYPGVIDGGSMLGLNEINALPYSRDSNERGDYHPDLRALVAVKPDSDLIGVARMGGLTSSLAIPTGGIIAGQSSLIQLDGWTPGEMGIETTVALHINIPAGVGGIDIGELWLDDDEREEKAKQPDDLARLDGVKRLFSDALQYGRVRDNAVRGGLTEPAYDPALEALVPYARGEKPVIFTASGAPEILAAITLAKDLGVRAILAGCGEGWKVVAEIAASGFPVLLEPVMNSPSDDRDPYDSSFTNPLVLHEAGVKIGFMSGDHSEARNLPQQPGLAVAFGLPEDVALRSVTLTTAEILGVADRLGSIAPGLRADLILTDGSPLQPTTVIHGMFIGGRPVDVDDNRHTRLYEKYRERLD